MTKVMGGGEDIKKNIVLISLDVEFCLTKIIRETCQYHYISGIGSVAT